MSFGGVHATVSSLSPASSVGGVSVAGGAIPTNRKTALTAPQLLSESFARTKTV